MVSIKSILRRLRSNYYNESFVFLELCNIYTTGDSNLVKDRIRDLLPCENKGQSVKIQDEEHIPGYSFTFFQVSTTTEYL